MQTYPPIGLIAKQEQDKMKVRCALTLKMIQLLLIESQLDLNNANSLQTVCFPKTGFYTSSNQSIFQQYFEVYSSNSSWGQDLFHFVCHQIAYVGLGVQAMQIQIMQNSYLTSIKSCGISALTLDYSQMTFGK